MFEMNAIGHFIIYEEISSGGAAVIYRAKNKITGKQVALKVLHPHLSKQPEYRKRIQREAKFISGIDHMNLVKIYSSGEIEGKAFIEMEYFKSRTLHEHIRIKKQLKMFEFFIIAVQIAEGLSALHKKNIIHRDLSYGNILINDKNEVKITDFGLIKILPENTQFSKITQLTAAGNTFGTLHFMSPEQLDGQDLGKESDIFSFGVNLYYMLTAALPFTGKTGAAIINAITMKEPDNIIQHNKDVSFDLQALVLNLLCKNPENRIKGIHQISRMLSLFAEKEKVSLNPRPLLIKRWWIFAAGAIAVTAIVLWLFIPRGKADRTVYPNLDTSNRKSTDPTFNALDLNKRTSASLDEYLQYNFSGYKIRTLFLKGFTTVDEKKIRYEFTRVLTLIKGKNLYFEGRKYQKATESLCEIKYELIKDKASVRFIEEWNSIYINNSYRKEVVIDVKSNENWQNFARKLFLGSALLKNSEIMLEGE